MPIEDIKQLAEKIAPAERELSQTKGKVTLFALFLREDAPSKWDMVIAAPWAHERTGEHLKDIVALLKRHLSSDEMVNLSRIILTSSADDYVRSINRAINVVHGTIEVKDSDFFGMPMKHAVIMTSSGNPVK